MRVLDLSNRCLEPKCPNAKTPIRNTFFWYTDPAAVEKYLAMARRFAVSANHVCQDARTELRGLARNRVFFPSLTIGVLECIWKIFYNRLQFVGPAPCWQATLTATLIPRQGISLEHERKS